MHKTAVGDIMSLSAASRCERMWQRYGENSNSSNKKGDTQLTGPLVPVVHLHWAAPFALAAATLTS